MKYTTEVEVVTRLNKAAFLLLHGGHIAGFVGKYARTCKIKIVIDKQTYTELLESGDKTVNYKKYMKKRGIIKERISKTYHTM